MGPMNRYQLLQLPDLLTFFTILFPQLSIILPFVKIFTNVFVIVKYLILLTLCKK